ncbi:NPCBM/NEW2 domain-containing protein [Neobacillus cucumis]|uniref:NPCBM/NEW2 domain-containing protein n=1 Tax=Neobacillus cucumis TaxID=1740721 RepID=UPI0018DF5A48|nr:NPCBM/NEW2 domain-containing protein [Neobacillus cucumis]MBI0578002.1 NPCBM/NEW2 domain-containing protein [Neobacillus cucumis]
MKMTKPMTRFIFFILLAFMLLPDAPGAGSTIITAEAAQITTAYLDEMAPEEKGDNFYKNQWYYDWRYQAFEDINGNLIDRGIGFYTSYSTPYATYNIDGMNYTTFDSQITIDKKWIQGDLGKTAVAIFADDHLLFEKQLTLKNANTNVHINLPQNTKKLKILVKQVKGAKGVYGIVFGNARFSTGGKTIKLDEEMSLNTLGALKYTGNYKKDVSYYYDPFQDINRNVVTTGMELYNGYGTASAQFNIDQLGYNVFETRLSLDSNYTIGDYGKTAVGIYADDYKLYEKQLTKETPVQTIKLKLPKNTKNLYLITKQIKGARGEQRVVFMNPVIKKTSDALLVVPRNANVTTVGATDYKSEYGIGEWYWYWQQGNAFQDVNGNLVTSGIGLKGDGAYANYDITGMNYNTFTSNLSLDPKWIVGNYGKTAIFFYANNKLLYSQSVTKATGVKSIFLRLPNNTTNFKILIKQTKGALGTQGVVLGNAQFRYYSYTPALKTTQIKAVNYTGKKDVVTISNVAKGDIIKVYASTGKLIATSPKATGSTVTFWIPQIGPKNGKLYLSSKRGTMLESSKTPVSFTGEKTSASKLKKVTIKNNKKKSDIITVKGLQKYDTVYVYNKKGTLIAFKKAKSSNVTIYVKQLGIKKGYVYLTVRADGMTTSSKVKVSHKAE